MRLTVGQLPPSVYWRRRAVVVAAVLAVVLIISFSCSGDDEPKRKPTATPTAGGATPSAPSPSVGTITPNASDPSSGQPINPGNQGGGVTGAGATGETCADSELLVTAAAGTASVRQGVPVTFFIRVKNTSSRQCSRDLSAQEQELYLEQNQAKQWSSDACNNSTSSGDVRSMQPNIVHEFNVPWNGQGNTQSCTNRQLLKAGTYQLRARLGNIVSEPVTVTVSA